MMAQVDRLDGDAAASVGRALGDLAGSITRSAVLPERLRQVHSLALHGPEALMACLPCGSAARPSIPGF